MDLRLGVLNWNVMSHAVAVAVCNQNGNHYCSLSLDYDSIRVACIHFADIPWASKRPPASAQLFVEQVIWNHSIWHAEAGLIQLSRPLCAVGEGWIKSRSRISPRNVIIKWFMICIGLSRRLLLPRLGTPCPR